MDLFGVDWSDGWAGNITAELVGLAASVVITYLIVDRVLRWRLKEERVPLRERLIRRLESNVNMLIVRWGITLRLVEPGELTTNYDELEAGVRTELERFASLTEHRDLQEIADEKARHAERIPTSSLSHLAKGILEDIGGVSQTADRYANLTAEDSKLQGLIGDLEESGTAVKQGVEALGSLEKAGFAGTGKLGLMAVCTLAFQRGAQLRAYVKKTS